MSHHLLRTKSPQVVLSWYLSANAQRAETLVATIPYPFQAPKMQWLSRQHPALPTLSVQKMTKGVNNLTHLNTCYRLTLQQSLCLRVPVSSGNFFYTIFLSQKQRLMIIRSFLDHRTFPMQAPFGISFAFSWSIPFAKRLQSRKVNR